MGNNFKNTLFNGIFIIKIVAHILNVIVFNERMDILQIMNQSTRQNMPHARHQLILKKIYLQIGF